MLFLLFKNCFGVCFLKSCISNFVIFNHFPPVFLLKDYCCVISVFFLLSVHKYFLLLFCFSPYFLFNVMKLKSDCLIKTLKVYNQSLFLIIILNKFINKLALCTDIFIFLVYMWRTGYLALLSHIFVNVNDAVSEQCVVFLGISLTVCL